jgi:hypothetical protein
MSTLNKQAELAANRVDSAAVGLDPITILTIITQVLPMLTSCWNRNDSPDPQESRKKLQAYADRSPQALLKRTARRVRAEADEKLSKIESFDIARAIIEQALSADDETVAACCAEAPEGL